MSKGSGDNGDIRSPANKHLLAAKGGYKPTKQMSAEELSEIKSRKYGLQADIRKGSELGINRRDGESTHQFKKRLKEELETKNKEKDGDNLTKSR